MLCLTEVSPPKAPDGRTVLLDATTATQFRTFRHGIVDDKSPDDPLSGSTVSFAPNLGCGTVFCAQENSITYNFSLAQSSPVLRCLMPERVTAQKVSPCGNYLAVGGVSGAVYFISLVTGEMLWMRRGHVRSVTCLAFSQPCSSSASGAMHEQAAFLASGSVDTTCRIIRLGAPVEDPTSVVVMSGHSLCVTSCCFMKYVNRLVSVSKDRTCRISDALSGVVLKVFTGSVALTSVLVGPCDAVVACGGANGSITFFKQLDNTILGEELVSLHSQQQQSTSKTNNAHRSNASKSTSVKSIMKEIGCDVFDLAVSNQSTNGNNGSSNSSSLNNTDICKVVGPFSGGPESPIIYLGDLFVQQSKNNNNSNDENDQQQENDSALPSTITTTLGEISSPHEKPHLVLVSRDGFIQTYSWNSLSFVKDISRLKKGIVAACVVPAKFTKFATSTIADKPLIQKSALQLKKAPVSSAGARVFLMKSLWSVGNNSCNHNENVGATSTALFYRIRQRDDLGDHEDGILARNEEFLRNLEIAIMKEKEEQLLSQANELFASNDADDNEA